MELTPRQAQILALIRRHMETSGFPPTRAEIATAFGFRSPNAAEEHLRALQRKGYIEILRGTSRGIKLLFTEARRGIPVIGRVSAGSPILAQEHIEDYYDIDASLFTPRPHYLLRVSGMSMCGAGILDGDLLAVHRTHEATNGHIVVARLEDEVTVKRFQRDKFRPEKVQLLAENPEFEPIRVNLAKQPLIIEGLGVGIVRTHMDTPQTGHISPMAIGKRGLARGIRAPSPKKGGST